MDVRLVLLTTHVIAAILGVGPILAMALLASDSEASKRPELLRYVVLLSRLIQWALLVMLVTGLLLLRQTGWAFAQTTWLRISFVLFLAVGAVLGFTNRPVRKALSGPAAPDLRRVRQLTWLCTVLVAVIAFLMVTKPA